MATDEQRYGAPMIATPSVREQLAAARATAHGEHRCGWCSELAVMVGTVYDRPPGRDFPLLPCDDYACWDHIRDLTERMVRRRAALPRWV